MRPDEPHAIAPALSVAFVCVECGEPATWADGRWRHVDAPCVACSWVLSHADDCPIGLRLEAERLAGLDA